jgi:hypothetical protein
MSIETAVFAVASRFSSAQVMQNGPAFRTGLIQVCTQYLKVLLGNVFNDCPFSFLVVNRLLYEVMCFDKN